MFHRKLLIAVLIGTSLFIPWAQSMHRNPSHQTERDEFHQALDELEQVNSMSRQDAAIIRRGNWNQLYNDYQMANVPIFCVTAIIAVIAGVNYFFGGE